VIFFTQSQPSIELNEKYAFQTAIKNYYLPRAEGLALQATFPRVQLREERIRVRIPASFLMVCISISLVPKKNSSLEKLFQRAGAFIKSCATFEKKIFSNKIIFQRINVD